MKRIISMSALILAIGMLCVTSVKAGDPPQPWPGPRSAYVFVEAESFDAGGGGWGVRETPHTSRAIIASGMKYLAGEGAGGAASRTLKIQEAGEYKVWVNFRQPVLNRGAFTLVVKQAGQEIVRQTFDNSRQDQGEGDIAGNGGNESDRRVQFEWGTAKGLAKLEKGEVTVEVHKPGQGKAVASGQMVDCVLLTLDGAYKPDYRDFVPQTYVRLRLAESDLPKGYFYGFVDHMRPDWYTNIAMGKNGLKEAVNLPGGDYLAPGESTAWINFTRQLYIDSDTNLMVMATSRYHNPDAARSRFSIDIATAPQENAIVSTFERSGPGAGMSVRFRPNLTDGKKPVFDLDVARANLAMAQQIEQPEFGKRPVKFPVFMRMSSSDKQNSTGVYDLEMKVLELLGVSGRKDAKLDENDLKHGLIFGRTGARVMLFGPGGYDEPQWEKIKGYVQRAGEEMKKDPLHRHYIAVQLTDEACAPDLTAIAGKPVHETAFLQWLKETGQTPESLGVKTWDEVKLTADRNVKAPALYAFSQRYRAWMIARFFKQCTKLVREAFDAHMKAHQNFSDGAVYHANMYSQGNDYFTWFRNEALDIAWSEDWTNGGSTPQLAGWNVALMRAAVRRHQQPIGMYVIASGRSPLDVKLKAYSDMAQGAKILEIFSYTPTYSGHEGSWYMNAGTYKAVMELCREIGAAEEVLMDAMPRRAEAAILYSRAYDLWNVGFDNAAGMDRMHTYLALRHAGVAVDVVDEDDVVEGDLKGRKVVYLSGEQLDSRVVEPLAQWVRQGGRLVLSAGAGTRDELNREADALDKALGISRGKLKRTQAYWAASGYRATKTLAAAGVVDIPTAKPMLGNSLRYFAQQQDVEMSQGVNEPVMKFKDGKAARVNVTCGNGEVNVYGFLPGLSYIIDAQEAFEARAGEPAAEDITLARNEKGLTQGRYSSAPMGGCFNSLLRGDMARRGGGQPVTASMMSVEVTFMEGKTGWVVPVANYLGRPIKDFKLWVRAGDRRFGKVYSARHGELKVEKAEGGIVVAFPLDSTDMVWAKWE